MLQLRKQKWMTAWYLAPLSQAQTSPWCTPMLAANTASVALIFCMMSTATVHALAENDMTGKLLTKQQMSHTALTSHSG